MPIWFDKGVANARAQGRDCAHPGIGRRRPRSDRIQIPQPLRRLPDAVAEAELRLSATLITFARHLQAGRFPYARMGGEIMFPQEPPDPAAVLAKIADATNVAAAIDEYSPPHAGLSRAARPSSPNCAARTAAPRNRRPSAFPMAASFGQARRTRASRCCASGSRSRATRPTLHYDDALVAAVKAYQKSAGLNPDGLVGPGHDPQPQWRRAGAAPDR